MQMHTATYTETFVRIFAFMCQSVYVFVYPALESMPAFVLACVCVFVIYNNGLPYRWFLL